MNAPPPSSLRPNDAGPLDALHREHDPSSAPRADAAETAGETVKGFAPWSKEKLRAYKLRRELRIRSKRRRNPVMREWAKKALVDFDERRKQP